MLVDRRELETKVTTEQQQIDAYCKRRDTNPMCWETEEDLGPVMDKGTLADNGLFELEDE